MYQVISQGPSRKVYNYVLGYISGAVKGLQLKMIYPGPP